MKKGFFKGCHVLTENIKHDERYVYYCLCDSAAIADDVIDGIAIQKGEILINRNTFAHAVGIGSAKTLDRILQNLEQKGLICCRTESPNPKDPKTRRIIIIPKAENTVESATGTVTGTVKPRIEAGLDAPMGTVTGTVNTQTGTVTETVTETVMGTVKSSIETGLRDTTGTVAGTVTGTVTGNVLNNHKEFKENGLIDTAAAADENNFPFSFKDGAGKEWHLTEMEFNTLCKEFGENEINYALNVWKKERHSDPTNPNCHYTLFNSLKIRLADPLKYSQYVEKPIRKSSPTQKKQHSAEKEEDSPSFDIDMIMSNSLKSYNAEVKCDNS